MSVHQQVREAPFTPYEEPESVQPTSGPAPSSDTAPDGGGTSGEDGAAAQSEQQAPQEALPEFDPKHRDSFTGLIYLGRLEDRFSLWGHDFVIRTLTTEDHAEIAQWMRPYEGTRVQNAMYQVGVIAAAVVLVDGQPLPQSLTVGSRDIAFRADWLAKNWMPAVREALWVKIFALEERARQVLEQMGKVSG